MLITYDLTTRQHLFSKQLSYPATLFMFIQDSKYLYFVDANGHLNCFRVNQNFKLVYRLSIFKKYEQKNFIFIKPSIILTLTD